MLGAGGRCSGLRNDALGWRMLGAARSSEPPSRGLRCPFPAQSLQQVPVAGAPLPAKAGFGGAVPVLQRFPGPGASGQAPVPEHSRCRRPQPGQHHPPPRRASKGVFSLTASPRCSRPSGGNPALERPSFPGSFPGRAPLPARLQSPKSGRKVWGSPSLGQPLSQGTCPSLTPRPSCQALLQGHRHPSSLAVRLSGFVPLCSSLTRRVFGACRALDGLKRGAAGLSWEPWHFQ